ncbi:Methylated-DNA--protein-cysteine methyltransferase [Fulvivirga imtechensis AK7]|uniref:Methylated-DNA--protein-cysteine methyltransferase n=1 Tax=Fulvivirga imtechensis AK7 TaxID=1237149 RepID=L8JUH2_9BACT|nr:methylated-DNA--[protein]-cysteine S-methyltransferase [Fulvivirga imtechensis]ELR70937.1 Methylated-DNA--protein-cysteine methyltransferase [Fulvivirga imtechensis AK7]
METFIYPSPIGELQIIAEEDAIIECTFSGREASSGTPKSPVIRQCIGELEQYFSGRLKRFTVNIKLTGTAFQNRVWTELTKIPFGKTITYSDLASKLGDPKCIRAAGTANGRNKIPIIIPCHRVIGKDGSLVGFGGGLDKKEWLLRHEGVIRSEQMKIFA